MSAQTAPGPNDPPFQLTHLALDDREVRILLAALMVVCPVGGGSEQYTLRQKIAGQFKGCAYTDSDLELEEQLAKTAIDVYLESLRKGMTKINQ